MSRSGETEEVPFELSVDANNLHLGIDLSFLLFRIVGSNFGARPDADTVLRVLCMLRGFARVFPGLSWFEFASLIHKWNRARFLRGGL